MKTLDDERNAPEDTSRVREAAGERDVRRTGMRKKKKNGMGSSGSNGGCGRGYVCERALARFDARTNIYRVGRVEGQACRSRKKRGRG
jgi:hypothetical protein